MRRASVDGELVTEPVGQLAFAVQDRQTVRQMENQVAMIVAPRLGHGHGLKLERQVVTECAIEAKMFVVAVQRLQHGTQSGENGGAPTALLLGEHRLSVGDVNTDVVGTLVHDLTDSRHGRCEHRKNHAPTSVQRGDRDRAIARSQLQAGIDISHMPPGIPARILHSGTENATSAGFNGVDDLIERGGRDRFSRAADLDPGGGHICRHHGPSWQMGVCRAATRGNRRHRRSVRVNVSPKRGRRQRRHQA